MFVRSCAFASARCLRRSASALALSAAIFLAIEAVPAIAQGANSDAGTVPPPAPTPQPAAALVNPTETAVGNLLQGLVDQGVLPRKKAQALMDKFHADLRRGPAQTQMARAASPAQAPMAEPAAGAPPAAPLVRVPYVPPSVKQEIADQIKKEMVAQAKEEHWATPNTFPDWVSHIKVTGDVRFRDEGHFFDKNNELAYVDVNSINNGNPYNVGANNNVLPPILNSSADRNFLKIRARFGVQADLGDGFSATIRIASGDSNTPVSTNQTLGGYFEKGSIWLNLANIKYEPIAGDAIIFGRMDNPFVKTPLVWADEVNLDGIAAKAGYDFFRHSLNIHGVAGAFPLNYIPDNFPANATSDQKVGMGGNKWLFAGQLGANYTFRRLALSFDAAYYRYANVQGDLSPACSNEAAYCLTDASRPLFMQKGNTLFTIRDLTYPDPTNLSEPQYYGIASKFRILDLIGNADLAATDSFHVILTGDYANNLAYNAKAIQALPIVNNNETCSVTVPSGDTCASAGGTQIFKDGHTAWSAAITIGSPAIANRWDWNTSFTYKRLAPDSVLDAFNDPDFHLGGTNARGWIVGGNLGLAHNTWLTARWLSSDAFSGPAFSVDVFQLDLNTKF